MVQAKRQKSKPKKQAHVKKHGKKADVTEFRSQLDALGLKIAEVTADGNCFFRALADQLEGNEEEHGKYRHMVVQYIMAQSLGDTSSLDYMRGRRVFEINPEHPIIKNLNAAFNSSPNDPEALRAIDLLYDTALISSGFTPDNPAQLGGKIYEMMDMALSGKWMAPAVEVQEIADQPGWSGNVEATEAEVVEPVEVDGRK